MNNILIIGNLTRDPETTTLTNGNTVTKFTVAVQRKFKKEDGTHDVDFFNCDAWGKIGTEVIAKFCKKGSSIAVQGSMQSQIKNAENDKKIIYWSIKVEDVKLLGGKQDNNQATEPAATNTGETVQGYTPIDEDNLPF